MNRVFQILAAIGLSALLLKIYTYSGINAKFELRLNDYLILLLPLYFIYYLIFERKKNKST